jgi:hypothetical protein
MSQDRFDELMEQAWSMPDGDAKIEILEEAVRVADALGNIELGFEARNEVMDAANVWGRPEKELVAFAWCLAQFDQNKEEFADFEHHLLWTYKRVLATLFAFPNISLERIEAAFDDFKARLEQYQHPLSTYHEYRLRFALHLGDAERVETAYVAWKRHLEAFDLDCEACWKHLEVRYHLFRRDDATALKAAQILFKRNAPSCNRVPYVTKGVMLEPLLRLGQLEEAVKHHQSYESIKNNEGSLGLAMIHLAFLAYANDLPAALALFEKHFPWVWRTNDLEERFDAMLNTLPLFERLKTQPVQTLKLRWTSDFPQYQANNDYDIGELETWIRAELEHIAAQFDARNGNEGFRKAIKVDRGLLEQYSSPVSVKALLTSPSNGRKSKRV